MNRDVPIDQVIFSTETQDVSETRMANYTIIAASDGLSDEERREIIHYSGVGEELYQRDDPQSIDFRSFYPLSEGRWVYASTTSFGKYRKGKNQVMVHAVLLTTGLLDAFSWDPFYLEKYFYQSSERNLFVKEYPQDKTLPKLIIPLKWEGAKADNDLASAVDWFRGIWPEQTENILAALYSVIFSGRTIILLDQEQRLSNPKHLFHTLPPGNRHCFSFCTDYGVDARKTYDYLQIKRTMVEKIKEQYQADEFRLVDAGNIDEALITDYGRRWAQLVLTGDQSAFARLSAALEEFEINLQFSNIGAAEVSVLDGLVKWTNDQLNQPADYQKLLAGMVHLDPERKRTLTRQLLYFDYYRSCCSREDFDVANWLSIWNIDVSKADESTLESLNEWLIKRLEGGESDHETAPATINLLLLLWQRSAARKLTAESLHSYSLHHGLKSSTTEYLLDLVGQNQDICRQSIRLLLHFSLAADEKTALERLERILRYVEKENPDLLPVLISSIEAFDTETLYEVTPKRLMRYYRKMVDLVREMGRAPLAVRVFFAHMIDGPVDKRNEKQFIDFVSEQIEVVLDQQLEKILFRLCPQTHRAAERVLFGVLRLVEGRRLPKRFSQVMPDFFHLWRNELKKKSNIEAVIKVFDCVLSFPFDRGAMEYYFQAFGLFWKHGDKHEALRHFSQNGSLWIDKDPDAADELVVELMAESTGDAESCRIMTEYYKEIADKTSTKMVHERFQVLMKSKVALEFIDVSVLHLMLDRFHRANTGSSERTSLAETVFYCALSLVERNVRDESILTIARYAVNHVFDDLDVDSFNQAANLCNKNNKNYPDILLRCLLLPGVNDGYRDRLIAVIDKWMRGVADRFNALVSRFTDGGYNKSIPIVILQLDVFIFLSEYIRPLVRGRKQKRLVEDRYDEFLGQAQRLIQCLDYKLGNYYRDRLRMLGENNAY